MRVNLLDESYKVLVMKLEKDSGSIEPGKRADLVLVKGNPLEDISVMAEVGFVMKGGTVYHGPGARR